MRTNIYTMVELPVLDTTKQRRLWGTIDDEAVFLLTIKNKKGGTLTLPNYGAAAQSLVLKGLRQLETDVLLNCPLLDAYGDDACTWTLSLDEGEVFRSRTFLVFNRRSYEQKIRRCSNLRLAV